LISSLFNFSATQIWGTSGTQFSTFHANRQLGNENCGNRLRRAYQFFENWESQHRECANLAVGPTEGEVDFVISIAWTRLT
jgi:hypothetical protein